MNVLYFNRVVKELFVFWFFSVNEVATIIHIILG